MLATIVVPLCSLLWAYLTLAEVMWWPLDTLATTMFETHTGCPPSPRVKLVYVTVLVLLAHADCSYRGGPVSALDIYVQFLLSGFNLEGNRSGQRAGQEGGDRFQAVVRYRFHNVRGIADDAFRSYYLQQARDECDVLVLAETNCNSENDQVRWAQDWKGRAAVFWASAIGAAPPRGGASCRGMAIMVSNRVPLTDAEVVFADPGGRCIALRCKIYERHTLQY